MKRLRIGLALGSGSARGWSHIGVIDALAEAGINPDIVCGSSMGSLVGAAYACGQLPKLRQWAEAATWREIVKLIDVRISGGGLLDGIAIVEFLRGLGVEGAIESCGRTFAAVATELASGREVWLKSGPILDAVRASIALPGIFTPARLDGTWMVDGGLTNPVPVSVCRALGAEVIIAVNLNGDLLGRRFEEPEPDEAARPSNDLMRQILERLPAPVRANAAEIMPRLLREGPAAPGYFEVLANSINIMSDQITRTRLAGEPPHILLVPRLREIGLMEFHRAAEAIAEGRASVEQAMPMLKRYKLAQRAADKN